MHDSMTDLMTFSKERREEGDRGQSEEQPSDYYYDDSTGYRVYDPEVEDSDDAEEDPEAEE